MALSLDINNLVRLIKKAAVEAVEASSPFAMKIGEVASVSPLKISINQKISIPASQLFLTNAVRDHTVSVSVQNGTESAGEDSAKEKYTVHLGLKKGEKVLLLRCDGGQRFIVLDRLEAPE